MLSIICVLFNNWELVIYIIILCSGQILYLALMVKFATSLSTTRVTGYATRFLDLFSTILNDVCCSPKVIESYDSQKIWKTYIINKNIWIRISINIYIYMIGYIALVTIAVTMGYPQIYVSPITNRPIWHIPECIKQISHNAPFCDRNVHTCAHFCYKMSHCEIWHRCILGFVRWVYWSDLSMAMWVAWYMY